jgi:hypothetical protein
VKNVRKSIFFLSAFLLLGFALYAQADDASMVSTQFDMSGFPQWTRDLRRAEIVAFGAFPFTYFFTNFGFDMYRCASNGWDRQYAPWPVKPAAAIEQTQDEKIRVLTIAAGGAVLISLIDYGIVRYKRSQQEKEIRSLPPGTPIIIRKPLYGDEGGSLEAKTIPETESP